MVHAHNGLDDVDIDQILDGQTIEAEFEGGVGLFEMMNIDEIRRNQVHERMASSNHPPIIIPWNIAGDTGGVAIPRNKIGREEWKTPIVENDERHAPS